MTILFAANELDAFKISSNTDFTGVATANTFDNTNLRAATRIQQNAVATVDFTGQTEGWLHFTMSHEEPGGASNFLFNLFDTGTGQGVFRFRGDVNNYDMFIFQFGGFSAPGSSAAAQVMYDTGASANLSSTSIQYVNRGIIFDDSLITVDFHWLMDNAVGIMELFFNGVSVMRFDGDTIKDGNTQVDRLEISNGDAGTDGCVFSEVIVADEDTRGMRVVTLGSNADGTNTAWTGTEADIDDTTGTATAMDATQISSNTNGQKQTFAADNTPTDDMDVAAVCVGFRGQDDAAGVQQVRALVRTGGTDFNGATQAMPAAYEGHFEVWNTNPNTTNPWTPAELDAIEYGVEAIT